MAASWGLLAVLLVAVSAASAQEPQFRYNNGGSDWTGLCSAKFPQSPIDIDLPADEGGLDSMELKLHYPVVHPWQSRVAMYHDGAHLMLNVTSGDEGLGYMIKHGEKYPVIRIEFHAPSEHTIRGQQYSMEMQIVHQRSGAAGTEDLVVIAVLFDGTNPAQPDNKFLKNALMWEHLPGEMGSRRDLTVPFQLGMGVDGLHTGYYQYAGSMTSPPCTGQVQWNVLETVQYMSFKQRFAIDQLFRSNPLFAQNRGNNRAVQSLMARAVVLHNHKQPGDGDGLQPRPAQVPDEEMGPNAAQYSSKTAPEQLNKTQQEEDRVLATNLPGNHPQLYKRQGADWTGLCATGREQSPIDIRLAAGNPHGDFQAVPEYAEVVLKSIDHKGFALALEPSQSPGVLTVDGAQYHLFMITFHTPAEHLIDGRRADMEMQLVHRRTQAVPKSAEPYDYAVLSVLFRNGGFTAHPLLTDLGLSFPQSAGGSMPLNGDAGLLLNLNKIRGLGLGYYSYAGSLSWPPCTEGTKRFVLRTIQDMSAPQLSAFTKAVDQNYRSLQPANSRGVLVHNVNEHVEIIPPVRPHSSAEALLPL